MPAFEEVTNTGFNVNHLLGGGILLTIIISAWDKVKAFIWHFASYLICQYGFQDNFYKYGAVFVWDSLKNKKSLSPEYDWRLLGSGSESRILIREIGFKNFRLIFFNKVPALTRIKTGMVEVFGIKPFINHEKIMITAIEHFNNNYSESNSTCSRYGTQYIRGSLNETGKKLNRTEEDSSPDAPANLNDIFDLCERFNIGRRVNYTAKEYQKLITFTNKDTKLIDNLYLTPEMTDLKAKIERWFYHKSWFLDRSIQWKRGILIHGCPGTGKTSFITALAEYFGIPLFVFDLSTFTNNDLIEQWDRLKMSTPCFVVFEDFDSVFDGRKNVYPQPTVIRSLSFDCVLNVLDGAVKYDGIATFITTNSIDKIDVALGGGGNTRPGRIDYVYEMVGLTEQTKRFIADKIFGDMDNKEIYTKKVLADTNSNTPAQFKELCINIALESYNNNPDKLAE